jgi:ElaB/YqjD/DUF883 family membrane-anchored ribosome-binding protein
MSTSHKSHGANQVHDAVRELKDSIADRAETTVDAVKRVAGDTTEAVRERVSDMMEDGRAKASEAADIVVDHVKEHTGSSLLIAAAVGLLIGYIFGRSSGD